VEIALIVACFVFFFMSIVTHEVAHGWVALRCGDPTARDLGRISFNPFLHVDPIFSVVFPVVTYSMFGFFFGGAKPVPVVPQNFRHRVADDLKVTAAGPGSNLLIAAFFALLMHLPVFGEKTPDNGAMVLMGVTVFVNLLLGLFNLIPIPPLDGSHMLAHALPEPIRTSYRSIGSFGIVVLIALLVAVPGVGEALFGVISAIFAVFGHPPELLEGIMRRFFSLKGALF